MNGAHRRLEHGRGRIPASTGPLHIGGNAIWAEWFSGQIDDLRVYNRALTAAELQADMNTRGRDRPDRAAGRHAGADRAGRPRRQRPDADRSSRSTGTPPPTTSASPATACSRRRLAGSTAHRHELHLHRPHLRHELHARRRRRRRRRQPLHQSSVDRRRPSPARRPRRAASSPHTPSTPAPARSSPTTPARGTTARSQARRGRRAGKYGGALTFDGVNDLVTVADAASLDLTTGMTLEAWVRPTAGTHAGGRSSPRSSGQPGLRPLLELGRPQPSAHRLDRLEPDPGHRPRLERAARLDVDASRDAPTTARTLRLYVNGSAGRRPRT